MAQKYFKNQFAASGDTEAVPDDSVNTLVSYETGYTPEYELDPDIDPNGNYIGRPRMNQLFKDITGNLKQWQDSGYPEFVADDGTGSPLSYAAGRVVELSGVYYRANTLTTTAPPSAEWDVVTLSLLTERQLPTGFINGLVPATAVDADHDITIDTGSCRSADDSVDIVLNSSITKRVDAAWAVGDNAGGLFLGTVAADTTYHVFIIVKDSDGSVDAGYDTSITAANIPAGYTAYRKVFSFITDASANIIPFVAIPVGKNLDVGYKSRIVNLTGTPPNTARNNVVLTVPKDIQVSARLSLFLGNNIGGAGMGIYVSPTDWDDFVPSLENSDIGAFTSAAERVHVEIERNTDTLGQVSYRSSTTSNFLSVGFQITTLGYLYRR